MRNIDCQNVPLITQTMFLKSTLLQQFPDKFRSSVRKFLVMLWEDGLDESRFWQLLSTDVKLWGFLSLCCIVVDIMIISLLTSINCEYF